MRFNIPMEQTILMHNLQRLSNLADIVNGLCFRQGTIGKHESRQCGTGNILQHHVRQFVFDEKFHQTHNVRMHTQGQASGFILELTLELRELRMQMHRSVQGFDHNRLAGSMIGRSERHPKAAQPQNCIKCVFSLLQTSANEGVHRLL
jgi:hypothetical protein